MWFIWINVFNVNLRQVKVQMLLKQSGIYFSNSLEKSWIAMNFKCPDVYGLWDWVVCVSVLQERPQTAKQAYEQLLSVTDLPQTLRANTLQQLGELLVIPKFTK